MIENEQNFQIWSNQSLSFHNLTNIHQKFYRPHTTDSNTKQQFSKKSKPNIFHLKAPIDTETIHKTQKTIRHPQKKTPTAHPELKERVPTSDEHTGSLEPSPWGGPPPGAFDPSTNAICNGPFARTKGSGGFVSTIADSSHNALLSYKCADCSSR